MSFFIGTVLLLLAVFLILLVLVQRGRGGGLTGALGGMGGSSAFGAKAGDIFTRITIVVASIWICVCALAFYWANHQGSDRLGSISSDTLQTEPAGPGMKPAATTPEKDAADQSTSNEATSSADTSSSTETPAAADTSSPAETPSDASESSAPAPANTQ